MTIRRTHQCSSRTCKLEHDPREQQRQDVKRYANRSGNSGVVAYEIGPDFIQVKFQDGRVYAYTYAKPGASQVEAMKALAASGKGLSTYISQEVKTNFESKHP